ncbi:hypothetical protein [Magnetospirillum sulfuroxidans]|uniref:Uncharacterized protein n=1 Tax=Magnetospirillum sulfuroxidans TaxID=611300 RepID=A0ABS5IDD1_9PROT|nr:hypothetical protein [Magnetospirillum sulfuroxidans]MBR9972349.1 hypothetical protein [Magnetospirillum sulfuroxidans]
MTTEQLMEAGRQLSRAFALLERANDHILPIEAALISKRGLLDEARRAVTAAKEALIQ